MDTKGRQMSDWLKDVEKDQNLEKLADIELPVLTAFRRWFSSRVLSKYFRMGYYDSSTGKLVLGNPLIRAKYNTPTITIDATSAAAYTITGASPKGTVVKLFTVSNANRAPKFNVTMSDGTNTVQIREPSSNDLQTVQNFLVIEGWTMYSGLSPTNAPIPNEVFLPPNWTLVSTDANFVAADVMRIEVVSIDL